MRIKILLDGVQVLSLGWGKRAQEEVGGKSMQPEGIILLRLLPPKAI
jgi:hypothetical protein